MLCLRRALSQVSKEWKHPLHGNNFALPLLNFIIMALLSSWWDGADGSKELAKVLYWLGSAPLAAMTIFFVGRRALSVVWWCNMHMSVPSNTHQDVRDQFT